LKSTSSWKSTTAERACTSPASCRSRVESRIWISTELIKLLLLVRITQHLKRFADHLEGIIGASVSVLVRMGKQ
jgi:hypothetical protein